MNARSPFSVVAAVLSLFGLSPASAAPLPSGGAALVTPGDVLFCDVTGANSLLRYAPSDGSVLQVSTGNLIPTPLGVAVLSASTALVTNLTPARVVRVDLVTGLQALVAEGNLIAGNPDGITVAKNGLAYVTNLQGARIVELDPTTGLQRLVTSGGILTAPIFLTQLDDDHLVVTSPGGGVVEVNIATGFQRRISSGGLLRSPQGVALLPDGNLLVADYEAASLFRINATTGEQALVTNGIVNAWGVTLDNLGYAYVSRYTTTVTPLVRVDLLTGAKTVITTPTVKGFGLQVYQPPGAGTLPIPDAPANFSSSDASPTGVTLSWSSVPRITGYRVYRDDQPLVLLGPADSTHFDVPTVGAHTYCITAFNLAGESARSCDAGFRREYLAEPRLQIVRDVPGDQGGQLALGWLASEYDLPATHSITSYRVWRRLPFTTAPSASARVDEPDGRAEHRARSIGGMIEYWEPVLTLPAAFREGYGAIVATTQDSLPGANPSTAFFVSALTSDPFVFYDSAVDSGYSVDNLSPPAPPSLGGAYLATGGVRLSWRESRAEDLAHYEVYRGFQREFDPGQDALVAAPTDTVYMDPTGGSYHYKVLAVDVHGNRSAPSLLSPLEIPTPAWILDAGGSSDGARHRLEVRLARDFDAREGTVYRSSTPEILEADVVADRLAPAQPGLFVYEEDAPASGGTRWYWLRATGGAGQVALAGPIVIESDAPRLETAAFQPAPNPSGGAVALGFVVGTAASGSMVPVRARVIDAAGRVIRDLSPGDLAPGRHDLTWDGRNARGTTVGAGVYRIQLTIGRQTFSRPVVIRS